MPLKTGFSHLSIIISHYLQYITRIICVLIIQFSISTILLKYLKLKQKHLKFVISCGESHVYRFSG